MRFKTLIIGLAVFMTACGQENSSQNSGNNPEKKAFIEQGLKKTTKKGKDSDKFPPEELYSCAYDKLKTEGQDSIIKAWIDPGSQEDPAAGIKALEAVLGKFGQCMQERVK